MNWRDFFVSYSFYKIHLSRHFYLIFQNSVVLGITEFNKKFCISSYGAFVSYNSHNKQRLFICTALAICNGGTVCFL